MLPGLANTMNFLEGLPAGSIGSWTLVAVVLIALIKGWPALKKLQNEADNSLRSDLLERIVKLEEDLKEEKAACADVIREVRRDYGDLIADMRKDYEARLQSQGRQIDDLQREIYNLRRTALRLVEQGRTGTLEKLAEMLDKPEEES